MKCLERESSVRAWVTNIDIITGTNIDDQKTNDGVIDDSDKHTHTHARTHTHTHNVTPSHSPWHNKVVVFPWLYDQRWEL